MEDPPADYMAAADAHFLYPVIVVWATGGENQ